MSMVFLARGTATLGTSTRTADGKIIKQTPAKFETSPDGGCIAVGELDPDTMQQKGVATIFGDFDPAGYLKYAAKLLGPGRPGNIPDFETIIKSMASRSEYSECPLMDHCPAGVCRDCIVNQWCEELEEDGGC